MGYAKRFTALHSLTRHSSLVVQPPTIKPSPLLWVVKKPVGSQDFGNGNPSELRGPRGFSHEGPGAGTGGSRVISKSSSGPPNGSFPPSLHQTAALTTFALKPTTIGGVKVRTNMKLFETILRKTENVFVSKNLSCFGFSKPKIIFLRPLMKNRVFLIAFEYFCCPCQIKIFWIIFVTP